jgi:DNA-binding SARP family transcriptional activator
MMGISKISPKLEIALLGPPTVRLNGEPEPRWESSRHEALLYYLILAGGPQTRERLLGFFWPDLPAERARANLRRALWMIRRALPVEPPLLITDRQSVAFNPETPHTLDTVAFETALAGQTATSLETAAALYRGELLEGFNCANCAEWELWLIGQRTRLHEEVSAALSKLVELYSKQHDLPAGITAARRLLELAPWQEEAHRHLILLLALSGQRNAALRQYDTCREILARELDVEPSPETTALAERVRRVIVPPSQESHPPSRRELPFVGRQAEQEQLLQAYHAGRPALLEGEAGSGKSRLAQESLHRLTLEGAQVLAGRCREFNQAVSYQAVVEALHSAADWGEKKAGADTMFKQPEFFELVTHLAPVWRAELSRLLPELAPPEGLPPFDPQDTTARQRLFEAVARFLALLAQHHPVAFFLDNLHWADAATLDLLEYLAHRLEQERFWFIGAYRPEEVAPEHPLHHWRRRLGQERAVAIISVGPLAPADVHQLAAEITPVKGDGVGGWLNRESEGNPFILHELIHLLRPAAAPHSWQELPSEPLPAAVQEMLLQRVERLAQPSQRLLALAAVMGRSIQPEWLAAAAGEHHQAVANNLAAWEQRRLVKKVAPRGPRPPHTFFSADYEFSHDKIRLALYRSLSEMEQSHFHQQIAASLERLAPAKIELLAHHWAQSSDPRRAAPYLLQAANEAAQIYANSRALGFYDRAIPLLGEEEEGQVALRLTALAGRERICHLLGQRDRQQADLKAMADLAEQLDNDLWRAKIKCRQAELALRTGQLEQAMTDARQAKELATTLKLPDQAIESLQIEALAHFQAGDHDAAHARCRAALNLSQAGGYWPYKALCLETMGVFEFNRGSLEAARTHIETALNFWQEWGDPRQMAIAYNDLALVYGRRGEYDQAFTLQEQARRLIVQVGDRSLDAQSLIHLGLLSQGVGRTGEAAALYQEALALLRPVGDRSLECYARLGWGETLLALQKIGPAERMFKQAMALDSRFGGLRRPAILAGLAQCRQAKGGRPS